MESAPFAPVPSLVRIFSDVRGAVEFGAAVLELLTVACVGSIVCVALLTLGEVMVCVRGSGVVADFFRDVLDCCAIAVV